MEVAVGGAGRRPRRGEPGRVKTLPLPRTKMAAPASPPSPQNPLPPPALSRHLRHFRPAVAETDTK